MEASSCLDARAGWGVGSRACFGASFGPARRGMLLRGAWRLEARLDQPDFIVVCTLAFSTAFVLLAVLALAMRAITALFPERLTGFGTAVPAALPPPIS